MSNAMSLVKKIRLLLFFMCGILFFTLTAVYAQNKDVIQNYHVEMPSVGVLSAEELGDLSDVYEFIFERDEKMNFRLRYPKGWSVNEALVDTQFGSSKDIISEIVEFVGPPTLKARSRIFVEYSELPHQISAEHWVLKYMLSNGLASKGLRVIDEKRAEFFYIDVEADFTFAVRALVQINGNKIFLMRHSIPYEEWDERNKNPEYLKRRAQAQEVLKLQKACIQSFEVLEPTDEPIESLLEYQFLDLALVRYPRSWRQKAVPIRSIDRMEVGLFRINTDPKTRARILDGRIDINMVNFSIIESLDDEYAILQQKLLGDRLLLGEEVKVPVNTVPAALLEESDFFENFEINVYAARNGQGRVVGYEYWVSKVLAGDYYFFFTMLTPARDDNFFGWSQNVETYKLVLSSFDPNLDHAFYDE